MDPSMMSHLLGIVFISSMFKINDDKWRLHINNIIIYYQGLYIHETGHSQKKTNFRIQDLIMKHKSFTYEHSEREMASETRFDQHWTDHPQINNTCNLAWLLLQYTWYQLHICLVVYPFLLYLYDLYLFLWIGIVKDFLLRYTLSTLYGSKSSVFKRPIPYHANSLH